MRRWLLGATVVLLGLAAFLILTGGEAPSTGSLDAAPARGGAASLAISPVRSVVRGDTGGTTLGFSLGNNSAITRTYSVSVGELGPTGDPEPDGPKSAARWLTPSDSSVVVPSKQTVVVNVKVLPPTNRGASERRVGVTFSDVTQQSGKATVGVRAQITASVYVEGNGPVVRHVRLSGLSLSRFAHDAVDVTATLHNTGTVNVVPDSAADPVVGTVSRGAKPFPLGGAVAPPDTSVEVTGRASNLPWACWCQVRITASDGQGGTTTLAGRVLVLPWAQLGLLVLVLASVGIVLGVRRLNRRGGLMAPLEADDGDDDADDLEPRDRETVSHPPLPRPRSPHRTRSHEPDQSSG